MFYKNERENNSKLIYLIFMTRWNDFILKLKQGQYEKGKVYSQLL